jgi:hypothetical protein
MEQQTNGAPTPSGAKKNNTVWYIIIGVIILLVIVGRMVSSFSSKKIAEKNIELATGGKVSVQNDGNVKVSTKEGTFETNSGKLPDNWPSDAPTYAGTITFSGSSNGTNGQKGLSLMISTSDSADKVVAFYKSELASKGWTIASEGTFSGTTMLSAEKGAQQYSIGIITADGQTQITSGITDK